jgi:hypothetical protein
LPPQPRQTLAGTRIDLIAKTGYRMNVEQRAVKVEHDATESVHDLPSE